MRKGKQRPEYARASILVRFRTGVSAAAQRATASAHGGGLGAAVHGTDFRLVHVAHGTAFGLLDRLRHDPNVRAAVPNFLRSVQEDPNDASFWVRQAPLDTVRLPQAWSTTHGSLSTKIAVVDTGVDLDQPDLAQRILPGKDFVNGDDSADDDYGHGTMVAGIAAAVPNNGFGIAGAAWNASIIPVKVLDASGQGTDADIANGITWAADQRASIINLSLGGPENSPVLQQAVDYALSKDALVVAAAGNSGSSDPSYPAAYPGVIAVASTNDAGESSGFSNHGSWVDLAAPGEDIYSTARASQGLADYTSGSGTSFASPFVAGIAALVRSANPTWTEAQVANRLDATARDMGPPGIDDSYGHGLVDAAAALGASRQPASRPPPDALEPDGTPDEAKPLASEASATISPENDVDWYSVDVANAGTWLTFTVTPPQGDTFDPVLEAYTSDLRLLGSADRGGAGAGEQLVVPANAAGRYYVRVSNYEGSRTTSALSTRSDFQSPDYTISVTQGSAPGGRFAPAEVYSVSSESWPQWAAIADLTGDGRNDAILSTSFYSDPENDNKVFVFPQLADGSLGRPTRIDPGCAGPVGVVGDLNDDGKDDLAVGCGDGGIKIYFQSGGQLGAPVTLTDPKASSFQIVDVNGDGLNDIVAPTLRGIEVAHNTGTGFATTVVTALRLQPQAGDVTGDGRPDIVAINKDQDDLVYVFRQNSDGSFASPVTYTVPGSPFTPGGLAVGDVTGDGRGDVVVPISTNSPNAIVNVLSQTSAGTLAAPVSYQTLDLPGASTIADIDGDGRQDVVTAHDGWSSVGLLRQNASGGLAPEELYGIGYASFYPDVAVGDLNGDGAPDLAIPNYNYGLVVLRQYSSNLPAGGQVWVRAASPDDFASGIGTGVTPTIRFARALDATSVSASTVTLRNGESGAAVPASVTYSAATRTITVAPSVALASTTPYVLTVAGVTDVAGGVMTEPFSLRFTTAATADVYPPETMIWEGSDGTMSSSSLGFSFVSEDRNATFSCSLNGAPFAACTSPAVYSVTPGTYMFQVRAKDAAGNVDPTPARKRVVVVPVGQSPPETYLAGSWPNGDVASTSATFSPDSDAAATFECSLDGAAYAACPSPVTYSGLAPGGHTFSARALSNGMVDPTPVTVAWTVVGDTTPPETTIDSGPTGTVASTSASFTFTSSKSGSTFECSLDAAAFTACASPKAYSGLADGQHTFGVRATAGGNVDPTPASRAWSIDTTPPETTITAKPPNPSSSPSASFSFGSSEPGSQFECSLDNAPFTACSSPRSYSGLASATHTFRVHAIDAVGNVDATPASYSWLVSFVDQTPPVVSLTSPSTGSRVAGTIALAADASDDVEVDHVVFLVNGTPVGTDSTAPYQADWDTTMSPDGTAAVTAKAVDAAANDATASASVTVDNTAPQTQLIAAPGSPTNSRTASFGFAADEAAHFECSVDGSAFASCTSPATYSGLADGQHSFQVRAVDTAGNVDQTPASRGWTIDATPPVTVLVSQPPALTNSTSASFAFFAGESATFECSLDRAAFTACASPAVYAGLSEGGHEFSVRAIDPAGNVEQASVELKWEVDATPPETTITTGPAGTVTTATARFTFVASETAIFQCSLDGAGFSACASPVGFTNLHRGQHAFLVRSADVAGNLDGTPAARHWTVGAALQPPPVCHVPRLTGKTLATARRALLRNHCRLGTVRHAWSQRVRRGRIVVQSPGPRKRLPRRARVKVVVSRGPQH